MGSCSLHKDYEKICERCQMEMKLALARVWDSIEKVADNCPSTSKWFYICDSLMNSVREIEIGLGIPQ